MSGRMALRSQTRALALSESFHESETEMHLQGDLSLVCKFLHGEGWSFATNSQDVRPPLTKNDPCVLSEGFGIRDFPQAQVREWPASTTTTVLRIEICRTDVGTAFYGVQNCFASNPNR